MITTLTGSNSKYILTKSGADINFTGAIKSICKGLVIAIGKVSGSYSITVQSNHDECIRYCNLVSCSVSLNEVINAGAEVGQSKYKFRLEYCTSYQDSSVDAVRVFSRTYYKQSVADIIDGKYLPDYQVDSNNSTVLASDTFGLQFTDAQKQEFLNCRGDNIVEL